MATLRQAQQKAKSLTPQKVSRDLFAFIKTLEKELADYNRRALNERSQDIEGKPIGFYSKGTELITTGKFFAGETDRIKAQGEPFDLDDTGKFLKSVFSKVEEDSVLFGATDSKLIEIFQNTLTNNLFGLQDKDLSEFIEKRIRPFLLQYYRKLL